MNTRRKQPTRELRPTALIVGEGYAEHAFLCHLRALYTANNQGVRLSIGNARGKGAKHVVEYTIKQAAQADYDCVASLLDTDKDWTPAVIAKARQHKIILLPSEPCLEAWLLEILGKQKAGDSKFQKDRFREICKCSADTAGVFEKHFPRELLDAARPAVALLDALVNILEGRALRRS